MKQLRVYVDTSVFGGCFDDEFSGPSRKLFEEVRQGRFVVLVSAASFRELEHAPPQVRSVLTDLSDACLDVVPPSQEILDLRDAYVAAGVVGAASLVDAEHIAAASVAGADLIVSWNFKHIVHFDKIRGYHAVNLVRGYGLIPIHSPREVIRND